MADGEGCQNPAKGTRWVAAWRWTAVVMKWRQPDSRFVSSDLLDSNGQRAPVADGRREAVGRGGSETVEKQTYSYFIQTHLRFQGTEEGKGTADGKPELDGGGHGGLEIQGEEAAERPPDRHQRRLQKNNN